MSTSNRTPFPMELADLPSGSGVGPGILSPAELARLANEMFQALPDSAQQPVAVAAKILLPANSAFTGNPFAAVPNPTPPVVPGIAGEAADAKPVTYFSQPDRSTAPVLRPSASPEAGFASTAPAVPGGGPSPESGPASVPEFAFLQDARPLLPAQPAETATPGPSTSASPGAVPGRDAYAAIPASLFPEFSSSQLEGAPQPPTPTVPGALGTFDFSPVPAFSFMEEARPLFSVPPSIPGPSPGPSPGPVPFTSSPDHASIATGPFAAPLDSKAPQFPGAVAHPAGHPDPALSGASDLPRQLDASNVLPALTPVRVVPETAQPGPVSNLGLSPGSFEVETIRRDFPILRERVNGHPLIWFDNGATTQKPQSVIDRISYFYEHENSNVHRAAHELAARATDAYESAREKTRRFLNAGSAREIIFVRGATEAINLVAQAWGRRNVEKDDEIVITWLEHHANIVPWQMLCAEKGARLRIAPVDDSGQVLLDEYEKLLGPRTRLVSITQVSNALGTIVPVAAMTEAAHRHGARVLVDGAQAVSHMRVDVQSIGCDFYVFSGHKVFAPTGIGVVYGRSDVLDNMPPWQGGGNMIQDVTFEKTLYQPPPQRFEAGTGNIADAVGLGAAIDYLDRVGIENVSRYEHMLLTYATAELNRIPGLHLIGTAREKASVLSFVMDGFRTEEIGDYLNRRGIAVRGGHHCAQPILRRFGVESTLRATLALYNTCEEVDALVAALWDLRQGRSAGPV